MREIKIGDFLYKYLSFNGVAKYEIKAIITRENNSIQYELLCLACKHGYNCRLIVVQDLKYDYCRFVSMIACGEEDEYENSKKHEMWHRDENMFYYTENEALLNMYENIYEKHKEQVEKNKEILEKSINMMEEYKAHCDNINKLLTK